MCGAQPETHCLGDINSLSATTFRAVCCVNTRGKSMSYKTVSVELIASFSSFHNLNVVNLSCCNCSSVAPSS